MRGERWYYAVIHRTCILIAIILFLPIILSPNVKGPPTDDRYVAMTVHSKTYALEGNFLDPVFGPSSPKDPTRLDGRLWIIIAHDTGLIEMNALDASGTPFEPASANLSLRIQDFGLSTPLSNVLYMVPGRNRVGQVEQRDDLTKNGLLVFVADRELVFLDPFENRTIARRSIGFQPTWLVQDVVSAGEMFDFPFQMGGNPDPTVCSRFILAANQTRFSLFSVNYRSNQDDPVLASGDPQDVASVDIPFTGIPLIYFNRILPDKSAIFIPTTNGSLAVFSLDGTLSKLIPIALQGIPGQVSGPIGFIRAPEVQMIYVPINNPARGGILYLQPKDVSAGDIVETAVLVGDSGCTIDMLPDPGNAFSPYFVCSITAVPRHDVILRGLANGTMDPGFEVDLGSEARSFFFSPTTSQVMALDTAGTVWSASSVDEWRKVDFFGDSNPQRTHLMYLGDSGGSKYSIISGADAMLGFMFESGTGKATVFHLDEPWSPPIDGDGNLPAGTSMFLISAVAGVIAAVFIVIILVISSRQARKRQPPLG